MNRLSWKQTAGLSLAAALLLTSTAAAQTEAETEINVECRADESPVACWNRHVVADASTVVGEKARAKAEEASKETLEKSPPAAESGGLNLLGTKKNFLSFLSLTGILGEATEEGEEGVTVFDVNFPFLAANRNVKLRAAVNNQPAIAPAIQKALPEDSREDLTQTLGKSLGDLDDYSVSASYSRMSKRFGRGFEHYRNRFGSLAEAVQRPYDDDDPGLDRLAELSETLQELTEALNQAEQATPEEEEATRVESEAQEAPGQSALDRVLDDLQSDDDEEPAEETAEGVTIDPGTTTFDEIQGFIQAAKRLELVGGRSNLTPGQMAAITEEAARRARKSTAQLRKDYEEAIAIELENLREVDNAYKANGLDAFGALVDNQPQLVAELKKTIREPLVGGDEFTFKLSYEWAATSLNRAMSRDCDRALETTAPETLEQPILDRCKAEYSTFVAENREAIEKGHRFSFSVEYADVDGDSADISSLGLDGLSSVALPESDMLIIDVGWSRKFVLADGKPVHMDLVGKYENVSDDPARRDRGIVSLTVTRKFGEVSIPFGIVYANHGKFLGDVDEQISTHIGLRFDLGKPGK